MSDDLAPSGIRSSLARSMSGLWGSPLFSQIHLPRKIWARKIGPVPGAASSAFYPIFLFSSIWVQTMQTEEVISKRADSLLFSQCGRLSEFTHWSQEFFIGLLRSAIFEKFMAVSQHGLSHSLHHRGSGKFEEGKRSLWLLPGFLSSIFLPFQTQH